MSAALGLVGLLVSAGIFGLGVVLSWQDVPREDAPQVVLVGVTLVGGLFSVCALAVFS
jgi:hypothetical protein